MSSVANSTVVILDLGRMDGLKLHRIKVTTTDGMLNYDLSALTVAEKAKLGMSRFVKAIDIYAVDDVDPNIMYAHIYGW